MLSKLMYVSTQKPNCTSEEIDKILDACKRNNSKTDVTGVLLYSDSHFVQYLEGEYKAINALYDKIKLDDRHKNVVLISTGLLKERVFPSWQMGSKKFSEDSVKFNTEISTEDAKTFQEILQGKGQEGNNVITLIKKFFK